MKQTMKNENGSIIISSLLVITSLAFLGSSMIHLQDTENMSTLNSTQGTQAFQVGSGGIEYALDRIDIGLSPDVTDKSLGNGTFTVASNPSTQEVFVTGKVGIAKQKQKVHAKFAEQCVNPDLTTSYANSNELKGMELVKVCNQRAIISKIKLDWNWSSCAQDLACTASGEPTADPDDGKTIICHIPPGNPANKHTISVGTPALNAHLNHGDYEGHCDPQDQVSGPFICEGYEDDVPLCPKDDGNAQIQDIVINGQNVAVNQNAGSGTIIDLIDYNFDANQAYKIDSVTFSEPIPTDSWFGVTFYFADGSKTTGSFKFGPE